MGEFMGRSKLGWKLGLTYLVVITILLLVISWLTLNYFQESYLGERRSTGFAYANIMASKVTPGLWQRDYEHIRYLVRTYGEEIGHRVIVVDRQGEVLGDSADNLVGQSLQRAEVVQALQGRNVAELVSSGEFGDVLHLALPVRSGDRTLGAILLAIDVNDITEFMGDIRRQLSWIGLSAGLTVFLISMILADVLTKPIRLLIKGVGRMEQGDYGYQVPVITRDELGELAVTFNQMSNQLATEDELRRRFVADAAHELRSPVAAVKVMLENTLRKMAHNPETQEELQAMEQELDRLSKLVNDLLILSSVEKARNSLVKEEVSVGELIASVGQDLLPLARLKHIRLSWEAQEALYWPLDGQRIFRVIYNLVDNAIKYSPDGGEVGISYRVQDDKLYITVTDQGEGIPPEERERIFQRFYRADKARSRATGGTGLGLAIAREIAQLHGGDITVSGDSGEGSVFTLLLPHN